MKILICSFSFPCFEMNISDGRFVFSEVMGYAENGAEVIVLTPLFPGANETEKFNNQVTIKRFPYFYPKSLQVLRKPGVPIYDSKSILAVIQIPILCFIFLIKIIQYAKDVDIIHAQWTPTAFLALPAKWIFKNKLVLTARGSDIRLLPDWLNRLIFKNVDAAIDCFGPTKWNLQNKSKFKANYITLPHLVYDDSKGNAPDDIKALVNSKNVFIILYVGRFHTIKIQENKLPLLNLIHAGSILKNNNIDFHVLYTGDGDLNIIKKLEKLVTESNLEQNVTLLGAKTNIMDYMHYCNIGIGGIAFNGVSQEFTICKKPQLLMDTTENADIPWQHGHNCLFLKPDNIQDLADNLLWAQSNPDKIKHLGEQAAIDMQDYFIESKAGGHFYIDAFKELMK